MSFRFNDLPDGQTLARSSYIRIGSCTSWSAGQSIKCIAIYSVRKLHSHLVSCALCRAPTGQEGALSGQLMWWPWCNISFLFFLFCFLCLVAHPMAAGTCVCLYGRVMLDSLLLEICKAGWAGCWTFPVMHADRILSNCHCHHPSDSISQVRSLGVDSPPLPFPSSLLHSVFSLVLLLLYLRYKKKESRMSLIQPQKVLNFFNSPSHSLEGAILAL